MIESAANERKTTTRLQENRRALLEIALSIVLPMIAAGLIVMYYPFRLAFEMDLDEGLNLMKALLLARGYPLYAEIWSDQPPLFTYILAAVMGILGFKANVARIAVLGLSAGLMWGVYGFLKLSWGRLAAIAGLVLLALSPYYARLSLSVMVGLPALAFATLSLTALALWHLQHKRLWLVLSAAALGLSVLTKIFTGFLAPIFIAGLLLEAYSRREEPAGWRSTIRPALEWALVFGGVTMILGVALVGPTNLGQLIAPHLEARSLDLYEGLYTLDQVLFEAYPLLAMAGAGAALSLLAKRWLALYPLAWIVTSLGLLSFHSPFWYHHLLLITIPGAILAAAGVHECISTLAALFKTPKPRPLMVLLSLLALGGLIWFYDATASMTLEDFENTPLIARLDEPVNWEVEAKFIDEISEYAGQNPGGWIVTDLPMYAFQTRLLVPPELAVISTKRLATGHLAEQEIIEVIREYRPDLVFLGRNRYPLVYDYLDQEYRLVESRQKRRLYQRTPGTLDP